jgi:hypothetical protein
MELIKKLKSRKLKSGNYESRGLFLCKKCGKEVEKPLSNGKKAISCGCTKDKRKTSYYTTKDEAIEKGGLIFLENMSVGLAKFQCPYCDVIFGEKKKRAKDQKSCGCLKRGKIRDTKPPFFFTLSPVTAGRCKNCAWDIGPGDRVLALLLNGQWEVVCESCGTTDFIVEELKKKYLDYVNSDIFFERIFYALPDDNKCLVPIIVKEYISDVNYFVRFASIILTGFFRSLHSFHSHAPFIQCN